MHIKRAPKQSSSDEARLIKLWLAVCVVVLSVFSPYVRAQSGVETIYGGLDQLSKQNAMLSNEVAQVAATLANLSTAVADVNKGLVDLHKKFDDLAQRLPEYLADNSQKDRVIALASALSNMIIQVQNYYLTNKPEEQEVYKRNVQGLLTEMETYVGQLEGTDGLIGAISVQLAYAGVPFGYQFLGLPQGAKTSYIRLDKWMNNVLDSQYASKTSFGSIWKSRIDPLGAKEATIDLAANTTNVFREGDHIVACYRYSESSQVDLRAFIAVLQAGSSSVPVSRVLPEIGAFHHLNDTYLAWGPLSRGTYNYPADRLAFGLHYKNGSIVWDEITLDPRRPRISFYYVAKVTSTVSINPIDGMQIWNATGAWKVVTANEFESDFRLNFACNYKLDMLHVYPPPSGREQTLEFLSLDSIDREIAFLRLKFDFSAPDTFLANLSSNVAEVMVLRRAAMPHVQLRLTLQRVQRSIKQGLELLQ